MSDTAVRLLNSLKLLAHVPDSWLSLGHPNQRAKTVDGTLDDRTSDLRRAFPLADAASIEALTTICTLVSIPGGDPVVLRGEQPDAVYIVVSGLFGAYDQVEDGTVIPLNRFGAGDIIGDIGFVTGEAQTATIKALRDSALLRIAKQDLQTAAARRPGVLLAICSAVVQRLQRAQTDTPRPSRFRTLCLVPADGSIDTRPILEKIAGTLEGFGTVTIVSADRMSAENPSWFSQIERCFDFVLLQADGEATAWTKFCLRQCDRITLVACGDAEPAEWDALGPNRGDVPAHTPLSLMLLWQDAVVPARTAVWLADVNPNGHYHVRSTRDIERAARLIAGRGLGMVLSGGGAKALAHVGVIAALRQQDVQIDAIGGTSIGGIVAAVCALEWDLAETVGSLAAGFSRRRFSDFALPWTSLFSERAFGRTLGRCFGDLAIEDSPIPLFCVSTNLTKGVSAVHRSGRLATWLRATSAVPGICPPIMEENAVYVDGGVLNNMPIDAVRDFGVASVIAVDVGTSLESNGRAGGETTLPNMLDLLWRVGTIASDTAVSRVRREGDVVLRPDVDGVGLFDWDAHAKVIAAGYQVALDHLDEIKAAVGRIPYALT
jgi:NTE family protein